MNIIYYSKVERDRRVRTIRKVLAFSLGFLVLSLTIAYFAMKYW